MAYQESVDELLSDALSFNNEIKTCNTIHNLQCNDEFIRLSGHFIPTIYGVKTITIPQIINTVIESENSFEKAKYLMKNISAIKNSYLDKMKTVLSKIYPMIVVNLNRYHTMRKIYDYEIKQIDPKPLMQQSIFAEIFNIAFQHIGHDIKDPKDLYRLLTFLSEPLDWVDYYNIVKKYCHINFMIYKINLPTAKLFVHNADILSTPLVLLRYTNSKVIDLVHVYEHGHNLFEGSKNLILE
ncbi:uncharacterized protein LOC123265259 [Cotesia glomerata]|uniref:uncharacterized protein LOC123265259 n=1 Tax=Cotesia glomerata TaxID=32391 RepID=UPI001D0052E2|nr:uncharacterized protein LOC123265259 [Cotesia glomerata]